MHLCGAAANEQASQLEMCHGHLPEFRLGAGLRCPLDSDGELQFHTDLGLEGRD